MSKLINIYRDKFTVIPNDILFDNRLDYRSRGIFATILSLPDGWNFSVEGLVELVGGSERGEGKSAVTNALKHLETLGYLQRIRVQNQQGLFSGYDYKINIPPIF